MTSRRLFLVFVLIGLAGAAFVLAVTQPFTRQLAEGPVTLRTVGTSGLEPVAPPRRSDPVSGAIDAQTFRRIAEAQTAGEIAWEGPARRGHGSTTCQAPASPPPEGVPQCDGPA